MSLWHFSRRLSLVTDWGQEQKIAVSLLMLSPLSPHVFVSRRHLTLFFILLLVLISSLVYYGVYNEGGASPSKVPVDPEEDWVSRVDLVLVPPPLSVTSLKRFISAKEGVTGSSELFTNGDVMTPVIDDHISTEDGKWPGSTPDNHVMFKFTAQLPLPMFNEGSHYKILNSTGKALEFWTGYDEGRDLYLFDTAVLAHNPYPKAISVRITSGYLVTYLISVGCIVFPQDPKWWWHCVAQRAFRNMGRAEISCSSDWIQLLLHPHWEQRVVLVSSTTYIIVLQFTPEIAFVQIKLARHYMTHKLLSPMGTTAV